MSYCNLCNNLTVARLYPPNIYHHAENVSALKDSSPGCKLCALLQHVIMAAKTSGGDESEYSLRPIDGVSTRPLLVGAITDAMFDFDEGESYDQDSTSDNFSVKLQILLETQRVHSTVENLDGFTHIGIWTHSKHMISSLTLMVQEGDELGSRAITLEDRDRFISGRVLTNDHPPKAYFEVAQRWLETCGHEHSECGDQSMLTPRLPDRVIDVALHGGDPHLRNGTGLVSRYATLSHCWGGSSPMMTLTENLEHRMASIPLQDLPKTFREAVEICRALMIPYLWIDSICIIQDSPRDWQLQSSQMHSIYHGSTLTLVALDAVNPSQGLFIPKVPFVDVVPLSPAFGDSRGQAYVGPPTWSMFTHSPGPFFDYFAQIEQEMRYIYSQVGHIQSGLLETRGWAMQELRLSRRLLYFFKGEMMWRCTKATRRQNGCRQPVDPMFHLSDALARYTRGFRVVREMLGMGSHGQVTRKRKRLSSSAQIDEIQKGSVNSTGSSGSKSQATIVGNEQVRIPESSDASSISEPEVSDSKDEHDDPDPFEQAKTVFYELLEHSNGHNIQETWYDIVEDYSKSQLTFQDDKLPALSGMASRFHAITKDDYLAGHWRIDLERSLFWEGLGRVFRVKKYRAPTWSWASIDGAVWSFFLTPSSKQDPSGSVEILDAWVQVEGENPFGRISSGNIVVKASTMDAHWSPEKQGWLSPCRPYLAHMGTGYPLAILDHQGDPIGHWQYDDELYGMMPGSHVGPDATQAEIEARLVFRDNTYSGKPCEAPRSTVQNTYNDAAGDADSFWSRATYAPEDLLLVKGPTIECNLKHDVFSDDELDLIVILVLRRTHRNEHEYERVGIGRLSGWDESVQSVETLTIV